MSEKNRAENQVGILITNVTKTNIFSIQKGIFSLSPFETVAIHQQQKNIVNVVLNKDSR